MIVVRHAVSDPGKAAEHSRLIDEHKAYLWGVPKAMQFFLRHGDQKGYHDSER
ncbi:hypothetical protein ABID08_005576 [Rhizobium binae]|uniref:Uncharacterized protein n=1 Tax=Rhizobium binae TaxID=1138190 RepID=A0ABV2MPX2_9HYPH|nr:hypothetical protein [Rhizobium binae]